MVNEYIRGSEWRKWDLHVHTPCSVLNNQFPEWDTYVKELFNHAIDNDIACIGITDYFSIEGYKKLSLEFLSNDEKLQAIFSDELDTDPNYIDKIKNILILPNIEFRLENIITTERENGKSIKNNKLEYHLILSNSLSISQIEDNILTQLHFADSCSAQLGTDHAPLTTSNLKNLGKKLKNSQPEFADKSDYYVGCMCASINFNELVKVMKNNNNDLLNKFLFVLCEDDITKYSWQDSAHQVRKNIYTNSHLIFSSNQRTIRWGLTESTKKEFSSYKGCIWGSDAHKVSELFRPSENRFCWIKADPTFQGLLQVAIHPHGRSFIGNTPPMLDHYTSNTGYYIESICVRRTQTAKNREKWFDFDLPLNKGLIAIIGNKGSGKSALSDIIGFICHSSTIEHASFLSKQRFQREDKKYANDYSGTIIWGDGHKIFEPSLYSVQDNSILEYAKYLPQKYIESVCNNLDDEFQKEINKVIFSYIDKSDRGDSMSLDELIEKKSAYIFSAIRNERQKLEPINKRLISLEDKLAPSFLSDSQKKLKQLEEELARLSDNKPKEVEKPAQTEDTATSEKVAIIDTSIAEIEDKLSNYSSRLIEIADQNDQISELKALIETIKRNAMEVDIKYKEFLSKNEIKFSSDLITLEINSEPLSKFQKQLEEEKNKILPLVQEITEPIDWKLSDSLEVIKEKYNASLHYQKLVLIEQKSNLIALTSQEQQRYQKYRDDLLEWEKKMQLLKGDSTTENTIEYFKELIRYVQEDLQTDISELDSQRVEIIKNIHENYRKISDILFEIYQPIQRKLEGILKNIGDAIDFTAEITAKKELSRELVSQINKSVKGRLRTNPAANAFFDELIRSTDFNNVESLVTFYEKVINTIRDDPDLTSKVVPNRNDFYEYLSELKYLSVEYALKLGNKSMLELSPGERGMVLLVFYLALSKDNVPIIIDQPEDNLDNQSVYNKLVPCISEAKKHRQVIIVTHNPNIAVACDAEQILYCEIDKTKTEITYTSGSIENIVIRNKVIDVLEGTEPAFDLRKSKYFFDLTNHSIS
ncbi:MAG: TrlF family AAA-like ATPase [Lachnospiraceae bacterium]